MDLFYQRFAFDRKDGAVTSLAQYFSPGRHRGHAPPVTVDTQSLRKGAATQRGVPGALRHIDGGVFRTDGHAADLPTSGISFGLPFRGPGKDFPAPRLDLPTRHAGQLARPFTTYDQFFDDLSLVQPALRPRLPAVARGS
ncbi:MAG: hypothetical protein ACYCOU_10255 [Sulfobacillus sp.]